MTYKVTRYDIFNGDEASPRRPVIFPDLNGARRHRRVVRNAISRWGDNAIVVITDENDVEVVEVSSS